MFLLIDEKHENMLMLIYRYIWEPYTMTEIIKATRRARLHLMSFQMGCCNVSYGSALVFSFVPIRA